MTNVKTTKAFDDAGYLETFRLMKALRAQGYRIPNSLCGVPIQFKLKKKK